VHSDDQAANENKRNASRCVDGFLYDEGRAAGGPRETSSSHRGPGGIDSVNRIRALRTSPSHISLIRDVITSREVISGGGSSRRCHRGFHDPLRACTDAAYDGGGLRGTLAELFFRKRLRLKCCSVWNRCHRGGSAAILFRTRSMATRRPERGPVETEDRGQHTDDNSGDEHGFAQNGAAILKEKGSGVRGSRGSL